MPAGSSLGDHRGNWSVCFLDLLFQFVSQENSLVQCRRLVVVPTPTPNGRRSLGSACLPPPTPITRPCVTFLVMFSVRLPETGAQV